MMAIAALFDRGAGEQPSDPSSCVTIYPFGKANPLTLARRICTADHRRFRAVSVIQDDLVRCF